MDTKNILLVIGSILLGKVLFITWLQLVLTFHDDPDLNPKKRTGKSKKERLIGHLDDMLCKKVLDDYGKERFKSIKKHLKRERERERSSQWQKSMRLQKTK